MIVILNSVDGGFSPWSNWTECSVTCGGGVTSKSRTCTQPMPMFGGRRCVRFGPPVETKECNMHECPAPKSKLGLQDFLVFQGGGRGGGGECYLLA